MSKTPLGRAAIRRRRTTAIISVMMMTAPMLVAGQVGSASPADAVTITDTAVETSAAAHNLIKPVRTPSGTHLLRVGGDGTLTLLTRDGQTVWERNTMGLRADWGLESFGQAAPADIWFGFRTDWYQRSEHPVVVTDLTGDGTEDVVVAHWGVRFLVPGFGLKKVNQLTVLDGANGTLLWHQEFQGGVGKNVRAIVNLAYVAGTLVAEVEEGSDNPDPSRLLGFTFTYEDGRLTGSPAWRADISPGTQWYGLAPMGPGKIAVAYWERNADAFRVAAFDTEAGAQLWRYTADTQPQFTTDRWLLRYDESRDEVALLTQNEPGRPAAQNVYTCYDITALRGADGSVRLEACIAAGVDAKAFDVLDVDGDGNNEWVSADGGIPSTNSSGGTGAKAEIPTTDRVVVTDGDTGAVRWYADANDARSVPAPSPVEELIEPVPWWLMKDYHTHPYDFLVDEGVLLVSSYRYGFWVSGSGWLSALRALDGATGEVLWDSPIRDVAWSNLVPYESESGSRVLSMNSKQTLLAFDPKNGDLVQRVGALGHVVAATALDVDGDGRSDPVVGSKSGRVLALDADRLANEDPATKWSVTLPFPIHRLLTADLDGDGARSIIAVTGEYCGGLICDPGVETQGAIFVLRPSGDVRYQIPLPGLVWTVTVSDVTGDGAADIIVPTSKVTAYRGSDGSEMWSYAPDLLSGQRANFSNVVVGPDGNVGGQYVVLNSDRSQAAPPVAVGLEGATGRLVWSQPYSAVNGIRLWSSVTTVPFWPGTGGNGVAFAYLAELGKAVRVIDARTGDIVADIPVTAGGQFLDIEGGSLGKLWVLAENGINIIGPEASEKLPQQFAGPNVLTPATVAGQELLLHTGMNTVYGYAPADGTVVLRHETPFGGTGDVTSGDFDGDGEDDLFVVAQNQMLRNAVYWLQGLNAPLHSDVFELLQGSGMSLLAVSAPDPSDSPTPTPTSEPTPTPSDSPTPRPASSTTYYLHSASGLGNIDQPTAGSTFDATVPTSSTSAIYYDNPAGIGNGNVDPVWRGTIDQHIDRLEVDFWQRSPVGTARGVVQYFVYLDVGDTTYQLPPIEQVTSAAPEEVTEVKETFTTLLGGSPISIDPLGEPVSIFIRGRFVDNQTVAEIHYDSTAHPSSFTVLSGSSDPNPTPTEEPTSSPSPTHDAGERGAYPVTPNDPYFGVDPTGSTDLRPTQWALKKILAPEAWQEERATGHRIQVAVLDTGVDLQHEDLQCPGKLQVLADSDIVGDGDGPDDVNGHGTHVAGIIGACTNNDIGVAGVAPDATIMPFQIFEASGSGSVEDIVTAIRAAADAGAHVINMSLSLGLGAPGTQAVGYIPELLPEIDQAIEYAQSKGVVIVAAAGNNAVLPLCEYPALAEDIICVGATDPRDLKSWYSTFPNKTDPEDTIGPGLVAPGGSGAPFCDTYAENVLSTIPLEFDTDGCADVQAYANKNGTSMAAPHVAGVAALVYDRLGGGRNVTNAQAVIAAIVGNTDDLGAPGYDPVFGFGRVNALKAVQSVDPDPTPTPTATPSESPTTDPSESPTTDPSESPTTDPSESPTTDPSESPTDDPSESPTTDPGPTTPTAPSNLTARAASSSRIELAWSDNSASESGFAIERSSDGNDWTEIATAGRNATMHLDLGLDSDTSYFYRVRALNPSGYSPYSNTASATTMRDQSGGESSQQAPAAPTNVAATSSSPSRIDVAWADSSNNEDGFALERSRDAGATWQEIATTGRNQTSYLDTGLSADTSYRYRVRAYNRAGHSVYSNVASAKTAPAADGEPSPDPSESSQPVEPLAVGSATSSIAASRELIGFKKGVELSGVVERDDNCTGPLEVEVSRRIHGTNSYKSLGSTPVNGAGAWGLQVKGKRNAAYVAQVKETDSCHGDASVPTDVLVRAKIAVKIPNRCRGPIRGRLRPANEGEVVLQRRAKGRWNEVASKSLNERSRFSIKAKRCGKHRLVWAEDGAPNEPAKKRIRI